jgi:hypothetical protein
MSTVKLKMNTPVRVTSSRGEPREGRYAGTIDKGPGQGGGTYVQVNFAPKGKPADIRLARPKNVQPA